MNKTFKINNRRYLGNKNKLLSFICEVINNECGEFNSFVDLFSGTGVVASAFQDKKLVVNDILYSNYICNYAWFSPEKYNESKLKNLINKYNSIKKIKENYISLNFSNTYLSHEDCLKVGYIRENIEKQYESKRINFKEKAILITSLIYAIDKIARTCGHYDAYRKNDKFEGSINLLFPELNKNCKKNEIYNMDANELAKTIKSDVVYIDPPYNSRQYCDAYHFLENVALWKKPNVYGVAKKMDRTGLKSEYCSSNAVIAFNDLIKNLKCKYIILSYNNMEKKGNSRSNARISDKDIIRILKSKGQVKIFSVKYKSFTTGKSNILGNEERLFLCKCK